MFIYNYNNCGRLRARLLCTIYLFASLSLFVDALALVQISSENRGNSDR